MTHTMTQEHYLSARNNSQGICLACGEFRDETEPDAEDYTCPSCGQAKVQGIENALLSGNLKIQ
jgi:Zn finger protein HypA/HybF involved in hydrogenase expression